MKFFSQNINLENILTISIKILFISLNYLIEEKKEAQIFLLRAALLYHFPNSNEYSRIICRNITNKRIRNDIFMKANKYIGNNYYNEYIIIGDDMSINNVTYQFTNNFSNIR